MKKHESLFFVGWRPVYLVLLVLMVTVVLPVCATEDMINPGDPFQAQVTSATSRDINAQNRAISLKSRGYSARETYDDLMQDYNIHNETAIEKILYNAGYKPAEFVDFTALGSIRKFTPVLKFDGSYNGLPMSAQAYFHSMLTLSADPAKKEITWTVPWDGPSPCLYSMGLSEQCGRDECNCGMQNTVFSKLSNGEVPTYYMAISDIETTGEGRLRIAYWWFYGFQPPCSYVDGAPGADGSHHGDWEKVIVTTSADRTRADYVTYEFHGDWYTRKYGGFEMVGDRPAVYVGKLGHGNYHSNDISGWMAGTPHHCCEYADYRNPKSNTIWYNTTGKLVSLRENTESWMLADHIGSSYYYNGEEYTIAFWRWGPHISYCDWWLFGCMDWEHTYASGNHPTTYNLNWDLGSCSGEGCGTKDCKGLVYPHGFYYNQPFIFPSDIGSIFVTSHPSGAEIWIDGQDTQQVTPYTFGNIVSGFHDVIVKMRCYTIPDLQSVTVSPATQAQAEFTLTSNGRCIPEFPSLILPATIIIGFLGAILLILRTRQH